MKTLADTYISLVREKLHFGINRGFVYSKTELLQYQTQIKYLSKNEIMFFQKHLTGSYNNEYRFKRISIMHIKIHKTGILEIEYNDFNVVTHQFKSFYFVEDFIQRFLNLENFCNFIFAKYLVNPSKLDELVEKFFEEFPNYSSPYGMPENKIFLQRKYKNRIILSYLSNKEINERELKKQFDHTGNWDEKLPSLKQMISFLKENVVNKTEMLEDHFKKMELVTKYTIENNISASLIIYNYVSDFFEILDTKNPLIKGVPLL